MVTRHATPPKQSADAGFSLALFCLGAASFLPFFSLYQGASINDEGVVSLGAYRLWLGQSLYTDFSTHIAPGAYYLTLLCYLVLGPTVSATRLLAALITGGLALSVYLLARRCLPGRWPLAPYAMMIGAGVTQWPILSYHWLAVLCFLLGTLALLRWLENPGSGTAFACGSTFALTGWVLQSVAAAHLLLTGLVALLFRRQMTLRMIAIWLGACFITSLALWAPVLAGASVSEIWLQNVTMTLKVAANAAAPYEIGYITSRWTAFAGQLGAAGLQPSFAATSWALNSVSYLLVWSCNYLLFYPVLAIAIWGAWRWDPRPGFRILVLAQLATVLAWSSRQTLLYLNFLTPVFFILLVWALLRWRKVGVVATWLVCLTYGVGYLYQWREAAAFDYPVRTVRGVLHCSTPEEARALGALYAAAYQLTPPGTPAFCYPYAMGFYFLSGVRPVAKPFAVIPFLLDESEVPTLVSDLAEEKDAYVYHFGWSQATLDSVPKISKDEFWQMVEEQDAQILSSYEPVARFESGTLYKRKAP